jgi:hypothetical protein
MGPPPEFGHIYEGAIGQATSPCSLQFSVPVVDCANLGAEDLVQDLGEGKGKGGGHQHEELGQPDGLGAHSQTVPRADGLGQKGLDHIKDNTEL